MTDFGIDQIHFADLALVLLKGRDFLGIGGPHYDRTIARGPSGVVGGVAIIFDSVESELGFLVGASVANPQIVVVNVCGVLLVGGLRVVARGASAASSASASAACGRCSFGDAMRATDIAFPFLRCGVEVYELGVGGKLDFLKGELMRRENGAGGFGERDGEFRVIEGGEARASGGIDEDELGSVGQGVAVPEAIVG